MVGQLHVPMGEVVTIRHYNGPISKKCLVDTSQAAIALNFCSVTWLRA
jgi:hypothetical protein